MFESTFDNMSNSSIQDRIIFGDFNCDVSTLRINKIANLASSYNLTQLIDEPTNYTEQSSSTIDLILVNKPANVLYSGVSSPFISGLVRYHCLIATNQPSCCRAATTTRCWLLYD